MLRLLPLAWSGTNFASYAFKYLEPSTYYVMAVHELLINKLDYFVGKN